MSNVDVIVCNLSFLNKGMVQLVEILPHAIYPAPLFQDD